MAKGTKSTENILSGILVNIKNQAEQNGDNPDSNDMNGDDAPTDDTSKGTLENPPVLSSELSVQFNMNGSMLSKKFFQYSIATKLTHSALNVYIFLGFNCDVKTGKIYRDITISEIASACDICNRTVTRAFDELQEKGFVDRIGQSTLKGNLLLKNI